MIQEPTDSTFNKKAATSAERWFTAKNKLLLTRNLTSRNFSNYRLSVNLPFPHFAPKKPSVTKYDFQWGNFTNFDMFYGLSNSRIWAENADLPTPKNELLKRANLKKPKNFALSHNALLSSEACHTKASALLRKHKYHCKPKMPRMPNLLEQFVMFYHNWLAHMAKNWIA